MNYLLLAMRSIKKQRFNFFLILIELAALFLAVNYIVSVISERKMLSSPYDKILNENSAFIYDVDYFDEYRHNMSGAALSRQDLLEGITDEYDCYDVLTYYDENITIVSINDEIFSRLKLPLSSGNRCGAIGALGARIGKQTFKIGDKNLTLDVTGKLTNPTFIPAMSVYASADMTTKDFFTSNDSASNVIITNRSSIEEVSDKFVTSLGFIIYFKNNANSNISYLNSTAFLITGDEIRENTSNALKEDISSFIPLIASLFAIVLVGVISISVISYLRNEYQSGILWLCGYSRKQIMTAHFINILVFLTASLAVSVAAFGILRLAGIEAAQTIVLGSGNVIATLLMLVILSVVSLIIPVFKSRRSSPIEYLRRAK